MRAHTLLLAATLFLFGASTVSVAKSSSSKKELEQQKVMMVIDASKSMQQKVQDKTKIDITKEILINTLSTWDKSQRVGIVAYGNRKKSSCSNVQLVLPTTKFSEQKVTRAIHNIEALGEGSYSKAIEKAAHAMNYTMKKATVVLISDGVDECRKDPCSVSKRLQISGLDFKIYVIGLGVNEKNRANLQCLAINTGGRYFQVENETELKTALSEISEKIQNIPGINLELTAFNVEGGPELRNGLKWTVVKYGEEDQTVAISSRAQPRFGLAPGSYTVIVKYGNVRVDQNIEIQPDELLKQKVYLGAGKLRVKALTHKGGKKITKDLSWKVFESVPFYDGSQSQVDISFNEEPIFKLGPGEYLIEVTYGDVKKQAKAEIKNGERTLLTIPLDAGSVTLSAKEVKGALPVKTGLEWKIVKATTDDYSGTPFFAHSYAAKPTFHLPVGEYIAEVTYGNVIEKQHINVKAGENTTKTFVLDVGNVTFVVTAENEKEIKPYQWTILEKEPTMHGEYRDIAVSQNVSPSFELKAGDYIVRMHYNEKNYESKFTIKAGDRKTVSVNVNKE